MTEARTNRWLECAADWVEQHERRALGSLIAFYATIVAAQGTLKLVWADELLTYYIAKQPELGGVWRALKAGADPNPPLMHVLVKASTAVLGGNAQGMRAPAMAAVLLAMMAMWWMLRRWVRPVFALAGVLAFMATRGFDYAYDARSYAPMMGFAMAGLACWMAARDTRTPAQTPTPPQTTGPSEMGHPGGWYLAGMAVALAAGISSNYYSVLAFFPIAVGEAIDSWQTRRVRVGVWLAMVAGSLPLLAYLPWLIRHNIAEFGPHAWNRPRAWMIAMSYLELVEAIFWPVLGLGIYAVWKRGGAWGVPRAEAAAVGVLLIYPFIGYAVAVGGAGLISPRCVAPVCCGVGLTAGVLAQRVFGGSLRAGMVLVVLMVVWVGVREGICACVLWEQRRAFFALRDEVLSAGADQILVADSSFVLPLAYYAEGNQWRIAFPIDFDAIHRFEPDDSGEQNLWAGRNGVFPFSIGTMDDVLLNDTLRVVVVGRPAGWLAHSVEAQGVTLKQVGGDGDWDRIGGVFTPMGHEDTRVFLVTAPSR
jgi:hypothetical protein